MEIVENLQNLPKNEVKNEVKNENETENDNLLNFIPPLLPNKEIIEGNKCLLIKINSNHILTNELYSLLTLDLTKYKYLWRLPPLNQEEFNKWFNSILNSLNIYYLVWSKELKQYTGIQCYMRIDNNNGVIEIGDILWSSLMSRSFIATETIYLMLKYVFELGYRRVEWKCDSNNLPSRRAAERFGFKYEGLFRQHMIVKGKNRDTAWFSILDNEWNSLKTSYESWLDPSNFDENGQQIQTLASFRNLNEKNSETTKEN